MQASLRGISSKATGALLARLAQDYQRLHAVQVTIESVGGVDAARRLREGEPFDFTVLDAVAIDGLITDGCLVAQSKTALVTSQAVVAIREGARSPDISTPDALRNTLTSARSIGYSTGPSGVALLKLIDEWGMSTALKGKLIQASPGVPVGSMVAKGEVELGIQQLSELMNMQGVSIIGPMPHGASITSTFTACICTKALRVDAARDFIAFLVSAAAADTKRQYGFEPA